MISCMVCGKIQCNCKSGSILPHSVAAKEYTDLKDWYRLGQEIADKAYKQVLTKSRKEILQEKEKLTPGERMELEIILKQEYAQPKVTW